LPSQIATAIPVIMQSAYKCTVNGPIENCEMLGVGIE
jgi:hypothetical protein